MDQTTGLLHGQQVIAFIAILLSEAF